MGEGYQGSVLLNVELVERQPVHEGLHQVVCGEVEDQAEKNGDGQSGERFLEDGEEEQGQTQALRGQRQDKIKLRGNRLCTKQNLPVIQSSGKERFRYSAERQR